MLVQSSSSSRARSKRVMNQTMFHVQTLSLCMCCSSHMSFMYDHISYLPPSFLVSSVWQSMFFRFPKHTDNDFPSLIKSGRLVLADIWLVYWYYSALHCCKSLSLQSIKLSTTTNSDFKPGSSLSWAKLGTALLTGSSLLILSLSLLFLKSNFLNTLT